MFLNAVRRGAVTGAVALVVLLGGCGGGSGETPPSPDPRQRYQHIPEDICRRPWVEEVLARLGLSMDTVSEPFGTVYEIRTGWSVRCQFDSRIEDGRFSTATSVFTPGVRVRIEVYHELAEAEAVYGQYLRDDFEDQEGNDPTASPEEITGWWDSGVSLEWVREDPDDGTSDLWVSRLLRHHNLVVAANSGAVSATDEAEEASALLNDLVDASVDATVAELTLTE